MLDKNEVKKYLHVDYDGEDNLIQQYIDVAELYVCSILNNYTDEIKEDKRYIQAVLMLIVHYNENRSVTTANNLQDVPFGFDNLIYSLKYHRGGGSDGVS